MSTRKLRGILFNSIELTARTCNGEFIHSVICGTGRDTYQAWTYIYARARKIEKGILGSISVKDLTNQANSDAYCITVNRSNLPAPRVNNNFNIIEASDGISIRAVVGDKHEK